MLSIHGTHGVFEQKDLIRIDAPTTVPSTGSLFVLSIKVYIDVAMMSGVGNQDILDDGWQHHGLECSRQSEEKKGTSILLGIALKGSP
jgi:hypothetical protein